MSARPRRWSLAAAALVVVVASGAAVAAPPAAPVSQRGVSGVPPGGPAVLYSPPPDVPEIQNRDARFRAPYEGVSGSERYVDGEYLYTDFLYDDANTYPTDTARYGNNAADLVEYRMSVRGPDLAVRLSLTTLLVKDSTIASVAFDSDRNAATGSSTLPRDPGAAFPGTDAVLTTWGTGAEWSTWDGTSWKSFPLASKADVEANQITVTVPEKVARPTGKWRATLVTGLYDPATGGWLAAGPPALGRIYNVGFRFDATLKSPSAPSAAYVRELDFDLLRAGGEKDNVPTHGRIFRMFASRLSSAGFFRQPVPPMLEPARASEGREGASLGPNYFSRLQPYGVYVPKSYDGSRPVPLTFHLHGQDGDYGAVGEGHNAKQLGDDRGSIVMMPSGRGPRGWYIGESEYDVFEAWNDVARNYKLDPLRTAMYGLSMGGYGGYRIALRYPHLFSRLIVTIPAIQLTTTTGNSGNWVPGINDNDTLTNQWVENARNLPVFHVADGASESVFYPAQFTQTAGPPVNGSRSFDSLGYRFKLWSMTADHALLVANNNFPEMTTFLGQHTIEQEPFHVTYRRTPKSDRSDLGLAPDRAYWVSDITVRDAQTMGPAPVPGGAPTLPAGVIDVVSLGFGKSDAPSTAAQRPGVSGDGIPYLETERTWGNPVSVPTQNRLVIKAKNVGSLTIDPVAARVDCNAKIDITSDGPLAVRLLGCPTSAAAARPGAIAPAPAETLPTTGGGAPLLALPLLAGGALIARNRAHA